MRIKTVLGTCLVIAWGGFVSAAAADDSNVIVDLSVLDRLSPAPQAISAAPKPLFPVVKKNTVAKKAVRKKTPKKISKKTASPKPAEVKVTVKEKNIAKVEIPAQAPSANLDISARQENTVSPRANSAQDQVAPEMPAAQPLAPVIGVEHAPAQNAASSVSSALRATSQTDSAPATAAVVPAENRNPDSLPVVVEEEKVEVVDVEPLSPKTTVLPQETTVAPAQPAADETGLLIDEAASPAVPAVSSDVTPAHRLLFDPEVSELSAEQQRQVDAIIASFKDPANNKIAIIAYNQDDGVDSFRKKRLSLDRVVKIRSYLLQKGYKDFAVKVINVDAKSDRGNIVEIEEM